MNINGITRTSGMVTINSLEEGVAFWDIDGDLAIVTDERRPGERLCVTVENGTLYPVPIGRLVYLADVEVKVNAPWPGRS